MSRHLSSASHKLFDEGDDETPAPPTTFPLEAVSFNSKVFLLLYALQGVNDQESVYQSNEDEHFFVGKCLIKCIDSFRV